MVSFRISENPTIYGLLALSVMEVVASQKPGSPMAILQQPTQGFNASAIAVSPEPTAPTVQSVSSASFKSATIPLVAPSFAEPNLSSAPGNAEIQQLMPTRNTSFRDLQSHWSQPFVELLATRGIISGHVDGTFQPDRKIQATHFGMMLHQAKLYRLQVLQRELGMVASSTLPVSPSMSRALEASSSMAETEAAVLLRTHDIRTRAQAAVFIYRNLQAPIVGQIPTTKSIEAQATPISTPSQHPEPTFSEVERVSPGLSEPFQWSTVDPEWIAQG